MEQSEYDIPEAVVFQNENVRCDGKVSYLPIYFFMFLQAPKLPEAQLFKPDIRDLLG